MTEFDAAIDRVAQDMPEKIVDAMVRVLPRELAVSVETRTGPFDGVERAKMRRLLDVIDACAASADLDVVYQWIETDLRLRMSKQVVTVDQGTETDA
jgi:hypothetical protein